MHYHAINNGGGKAPDVRRKAGLGSRFAPLLVALLYTGLSVVPIALEWAGKWFDSQSTLYQVSINHRNSVQVVVSVLASILGLLWSYSACTAFNLFMRASISKHPLISTNLLRLGSSISNNAPTTNLPRKLQIVSYFWFGLGLLPALIWTGALTPEQGIATVLSKNAVAVSQAGFEAQTQLFPYWEGWKHGWVIADKCDGVDRSNGTQHNCPGSVFSGQIVDSIRSASTIPGAQSGRNHTKLDKSGYNYIGRSYGAGSSVGLFELPTNSSVFAYNYTERGYLATSKCIYNESSAWAFNLSNGQVNKHPVPSLFHAEGFRPNDDMKQTPGPPAYFVTSFEDHRRQLAFSAGSAGGFWNGTPPFFLSIAAGLDYLILNRTQCELTFQPKTFNVTVSPANQTVQVTPLDAIPAAQARGQFLEYVLDNLQLVSMTQTTLYISTVAEAFYSNTIPQPGSRPPINSTDPPAADMLGWFGDSVTAALDDIMEALNGYGLVKPGGWRHQDASVALNVSRIGTTGWNVAVFVFSVVSCGVILFVTAWTRVFRDSPEFDFSDLVSVLAAGVCALTADKAHFLAGWRGDAADYRLRESLVEVRGGIGERRPPEVLVRSSSYRKEDCDGFEMAHQPNTASSDRQRTL